MKKIRDFTLFIILLMILTIFIINPKLIINSVYNNTISFFKYVFPSLFPFMILSSLLINYNVIYYISEFISKIFKIDINLIILVLLSIIGGYPSNAKNIKYYIDNNYIDKENGIKLISITFFPSIMFVLGTVGSLYLHNYYLGIKILLSIYITNIILLIGFRFNKSNISLIKNNKVFGEILSSSIISSINTLFIVHGSIIVFSLLIDIIIYYFNSDNLFISIISGIMEMSNGVKKVSTNIISTNLKYFIISNILVFGGLSIHSQILSILEYDKIYKTILITRLKAVLINSIIILISLFLRM